MASIPSVNPFTAVGASAVAPVALGVSNTLTYNGAARQVLFIRNEGSSAVTATLSGADAPDDLKVPGTGATYNLETGATVLVAAGTTQQIPLSSFRAYLVGAVTLALTSAADVTAWITEV